MKPMFLHDLTSFWRDERASMSLEAILMFPLLVWAYISAFVFFDAFRVKNTNMKAAYTISDMLSRETEFVDQNYLEGLNTVFDFLTNSPHPTWMRVTVVTYDGSEDEMQVVWSKTTKSHEEYTTASLVDVADQIPVMSPGDTVIVVETTMIYEPIFRYGLKQMNFENFIVTSPRFAPQLCWVSPCNLGA